MKRPYECANQPGYMSSMFRVFTAFGMEVMTHRACMLIVKLWIRLDICPGQTNTLLDLYVICYLVGFAQIYANSTIVHDLPAESYF